MNKKAIFIICPPRSGSTWLLRLLGKHSQIDIATAPALGFGGAREESDYFNAHLLKLLSRGVLEKKDIPEYTRKIYYNVIQENSVAFVDKTPAHVLFINQINEIFPDAYYIHINRDGRDVLASLKEFSYLYQKQYAPWGKERPDNWHEDPEIKNIVLDDYKITGWNRHTERCLWAKENVKNYYEVRYEDMLHDCARQLKNICNFVEIKSEHKHMIKIYDPDSAFSTGIHPKIRVWGHSNRWKNVLTEEDLKRFMEISKENMIKLGYLEE